MTIFKNSKKNSSKIVLILKILIWIAPILIFIWILDKNFAPFGFQNIEYKVNEPSNLVRSFAGKEPDKLIGTINESTNDDYYQLITATPIYFDVKVPRAFSKATVTMKYLNPDKQPVIKLGVRQSNLAFYSTDMAFFNESLEGLDDHWASIAEGDSTLWQKDIKYYDAKQEKIHIIEKWLEGEIEKLDDEFPEEFRSTLDQEDYNKQKDELESKYDEEIILIIDETKKLKSNDLPFNYIDDFFNNFPEPEKVLRYNYDLDSILEMPGYEPSEKVLEFNKSIRGSHEIYTYLGNGEDLNFIFTIQDSNRHSGEDVFKILVYNGKDELINEVTAPDDGEIYATGRILPERRHQLLMENMPFGTYRMVIQIENDDIFIKKIETYQHLVMFKKNVYLSDNIEYDGIIDVNNITPTTLYTNSSYVKVRTAHDNGLQVLRIGQYNLQLEDKHILNEMQTPDGITPIISPKNDVYIEGDGFFAFSQNQLFDPNFSLVNEIDDVDNVDDYDFILTNYRKANYDGEWQVASATIEQPFLYINEGQDKIIKFIIDVPGLTENDRQLKINQLNIHFEKDPITFSTIINKIKSFFSNILN